MLTLIELNDLLKLNENLTYIEITRKNRQTDLKRLIELNLHRSILKDCIIELLTQNEKKDLKIAV